MRNIVEEIHMARARYVFKTGAEPSIVAMNKTAFDMAVNNSEFKFDLKKATDPGLMPTIFGIEVKMFVDYKEEPEWYFGMRMVP